MKNLLNSIFKILQMPAMKICSIIMLGTALRLWGISWGLPFGYNPDENLILLIVMNFFTGDYDPHAFMYPTFFMYIVFSMLSFLHFLLNGLTLFNITVDDPITLFLSDPTFFYILARSVSAVFGILTIYILYKIGCEVFSEKIGLVAAFLLSVNFLHIQHSHFATTDVTLTFFVLLCYRYIYRIYANDTITAYVRSGIIAGLATSTKYNAGLLFLPITVASLCVKGSILTHRIRSLFNHKLILAGFMMVLFFILGSPYVVLDYSNFWGALVKQSENMRGYITFLNTSSGYLYFIKEGLSYGMRKPLAIFSIMAIIWALVYKPSRRELLFLCFPISYYLIIGAWGSKFNRYLLIIFPIMFLYAAHFFLFLIFLFFKRFPKKQQLILLLGLCILAGPSFLRACYENYMMTQPPTQTLTKEWADSNIPPNSKVIVEGFSYPPLAKSLSQLKNEVKLPSNVSQIHNLKTVFLIKTFDETKPHYQVVTLFHEETRFGKALSIENRQIADADYFIINKELDDIIEQGGSRGAEAKKLHDYIREKGKLLKNISPDETLEIWGWEVKFRKRTGPIFEIYQL
ncbi:MAG: glycosyltransferase family 39 protein [Pseudomonadota bacterium]